MRNYRKILIIALILFTITTSLSLVLFFFSPFIEENFFLNPAHVKPIVLISLFVLIILLCIYCFLLFQEGQTIEISRTTVKKRKDDFIQQITNNVKSLLKQHTKIEKVEDRYQKTEQKLGEQLRSAKNAEELLASAATNGTHLSETAQKDKENLEKTITKTKKEAPKLLDKLDNFDQTILGLSPKSTALLEESRDLKEKYGIAYEKILNNEINKKINRNKQPLAWAKILPKFQIGLILLIFGLVLYLGLTDKTFLTPNGDLFPKIVLIMGLGALILNHKLTQTIIWVFIPGFLGLYFCKVFSPDPQYYLLTLLPLVLVVIYLSISIWLHPTRMPDWRFMPLIITVSFIFMLILQNQIIGKEAYLATFGGIAIHEVNQIVIGGVFATVFFLSLDMKGFGAHINMNAKDPPSTRKLTLSSSSAPSRSPNDPVQRSAHLFIAALIGFIIGFYFFSIRESFSQSAAPGYPLTYATDQPTYQITGGVIFAFSLVLYFACKHTNKHGLFLLLFLFSGIGFGFFWDASLFHMMGNDDILDSSSITDAIFSEYYFSSQLIYQRPKVMIVFGLFLVLLLVVYLKSKSPSVPEKPGWKIAFLENRMVSQLEKSARQLKDLTGKSHTLQEEIEHAIEIGETAEKTLIDSSSLSPKMETQLNHSIKKIEKQATRKLKTQLKLDLKIAKIKAKMKTLLAKAEKKGQDLRAKLGITA